MKGMLKIITSGIFSFFVYLFLGLISPFKNLLNFEKILFLMLLFFSFDIYLKYKINEFLKK